MTLSLVEATNPGEYSLSVDGDGSLFSMTSGSVIVTTRDHPVGGLAIVTYVSAKGIAGTFEGYVMSYTGSYEWINLWRGRFSVAY